MPSSESLVRDVENQLYEFRQKNLLYLNEQYGHGFQALLVQLAKNIGRFESPTVISNLVNASKNRNGSPKTEFISRHARRIEDALDLPMFCLDVPDWHFQKNLEYFWQYAHRTADDRKWFDGLLKLLLDNPIRPPQNPKTTLGTKLNPKVDWSEVRARLEKKKFVCDESNED
jgi:hypothetical protein